MRSHVKKEGGKIQRQLLAMLRKHSQPLEAWWMAEQVGIESKYVLASLGKLFARGKVNRHGTVRRYSWTIA